MNKKGAVSIAAILLILVLVAWGLTYTSRECNSSDECGKNQYCSSDFTCKDHPVIYQTSYDLIWPAIILSAGIIIGVLLYRRKQPPIQYQYYQQQ